MGFTIEEIEYGLKNLMPKDFIFKKEIKGFSWTKKYENRIESIIIGFGGYPDLYNIQTPKVSVIFNEVENLLNPLYKKYKIENIYGDATINKSFIDIHGVSYSQFGTRINDELEFNKLCIELKTIINNGVIFFLNKFNNLQKVNEEIEKLSEENINDFISGIIGLKIPLIKKITKSSDFISELKIRYKFYSEEVFQYPQYFKDHEKVFFELFKDDLEAIIN